MADPLYVYIAGPYTAGDPEANVRAAIAAAQVVWESGHTPFVPHLFHFWDLQVPGEYEQWMTLCLRWLKKCDVLVRLPGESPGSDQEALFAGQQAMLVFSGIEDFAAWVNTDG